MAAKMKLKVVNIKLSIGKFPIHNIHTTQHSFSIEKFKGKLCFKEKKKLSNKLNRSTWYWDRRK